ncbi:MAG: phospholipase D-like domain-containing protein, partial [Pseudomonadota bacterium]
MTDDERPLADDPDLVCGNRVEILVDGPETYAAMFQAIDAAARSVHVVAYQVDDSEVGRALGTRLTRSAAAGADVCLMIDDFGSLETDSDMLEELAADGVRVRRFNPLSDVVGDTDANRRNHRKLMVIDGQVAFVGGVNFDERYQRSPTTGESADLAGD